KTHRICCGLFERPSWTVLGDGRLVGVDPELTKKSSTPLNLNGNRCGSTGATRPACTRAGFPLAKRGARRLTHGRFEPGHPAARGRGRVAGEESARRVAARERQLESPRTTSRRVATHRAHPQGGRVRARPQRRDRPRPLVARAPEDAPPDLTLRPPRALATAA